MKTVKLEVAPPDTHLRPIPPSIGVICPQTIDMVTRLRGLKRILVPIDFSETSERAITYAIAFSRQFGSSITLLHVVDLLAGTVVKIGERYESDRTAIGVDALARLKVLALAKVPAAIRSHTEVRFGRAWHVIAGAARAQNADLIILTTQGLTGIEYALLGSTAERVGRHAPCPVLSVRERGHEFVSTHHEPCRRAPSFPQPEPQLAESHDAMTTTSDQVPSPTGEESAPASDTVPSASDTIELVPQLLHLKNILVPIDFSAMSEKALAYAMPFAEQFGAKLTLAHIVNLTMQPIEASLCELDAADYNAAAQQKLEALARERIPAALPEPTATSVRAGIPWLEICNLAKETAADLIILTTHGYTGLKRVFLGSTAERVVRHAPCPVLVVREKEHEFV